MTQFLLSWAHIDTLLICFVLFVDPNLTNEVCTWTQTISTRPYPKESFGCGNRMENPMESFGCGKRMENVVTVTLSLIIPFSSLLLHWLFVTSTRHPFFNVGPQLLLEMRKTVHRCNQHMYAHQKKKSSGDSFHG